VTSVRLSQGAGWLWPTLLLTSFASGQTAAVKVPASTKQVVVSIVRRVDVSYYLVTSKVPLEFDVQGPTWLRVYTRLWWPAEKTGRARYRLLLRQDEVERPVEFEAGRSTSSYGPGQHPLGEWRSFYEQVPTGVVHYRLAPDEGAADTVAVRFALQPPKPWQPVAIAGARTLVLVEGKDTTRFYEIVRGQPARLKVSGPCRVRVRCRLNFDPSTSGVQSFVVTVKGDKGELARRSVRVSRSRAAVYSNEPALLPSSERSVVFSLPEGGHNLSLLLSGTLAKTGAVTAEVLAGEKYE
jgi:hypothetical protein